MTRPTVCISPLCTLRDKSGRSDLAVPITVTADADWLAIRPQGYGEHEAEDGHGEPILLEVWHGELRLLIGTDINDPNKSVISLEGAREARRRQHEFVDAVPAAHPLRTPHARDVLSPEERAAADADAIERFRRQAQPGQRLWMETTFCGTWCGTYRLAPVDDDFAHSSRYRLVHTYEALPPEE